MFGVCVRKMRGKYITRSHTQASLPVSRRLANKTGTPPLRSRPSFRSSRKERGTRDGVVFLPHAPFCTSLTGSLKISRETTKYFVSFSCLLAGRHSRTRHRHQRDNEYGGEWEEQQIYCARAFRGLGCSSEGKVTRHKGLSAWFRRSGHLS